MVRNNQTIVYRVLLFVIGFVFIIVFNCQRNTKSKSSLYSEFTELDIGKDYNFIVTSVVNRNPNVRYTQNFVKIISDDENKIVISAYALSYKDSTLATIIKPGSRIVKNMDTDSLKVINTDSSLWFRLFYND